MLVQVCDYYVKVWNGVNVQFGVVGDFDLQIICEVLFMLFGGFDSVVKYEWVKLLLIILVVQDFVLNVFDKVNVIYIVQFNFLLCDDYFDVVVFDVVMWIFGGGIDLCFFVWLCQ